MSIEKLTGKEIGAELERRITEHGKLTMVGFGTFKRVVKPARIGRNPRTGEQIDIPSREAIVFKTSK